MAEFVFFMALVLPAVLGLSEILHIIKKAEKILILIPDNDNFENQILSLSSEYRWQGNKLAEKIFVINSKLDEEYREECNLLVQKVGFKVLEENNFKFL